jgi:hypothetical protein
MDINEINEEIEKLEQTEYTTYGNCYKLAVLYTVRDHFPKNTKAAVKMPVIAKDTTTAMTGCEMPPIK